jgi:hypothetical protein
MNGRVNQHRHLKLPGIEMESFSEGRRGYVDCKVLGHFRQERLGPCRVHSGTGAAKLHGEWELAKGEKAQKKKKKSAD